MLQFAGGNPSVSLVSPTLYQKSETQSLQRSPCFRALISVRTMLLGCHPTRILRSTRLYWERSPEGVVPSSAKITFFAWGQYSVSGRVL